MRAPKYRPEGLILPNASPEPEPVFGRITWNVTPPLPTGDMNSLFLILLEDFSL